MKLLYISGPIKGRDDWVREANIRRAESVALEVWALGIVAVCPHVLTRAYGNSLPETIWLRGDLELLSRCDGLLAIDGWQASTGARIEVLYAQERGLPVFVSVGEVEQVWGEQAEVLAPTRVPGLC